MIALNSAETDPGYHDFDSLRSEVLETHQHFVIITDCVDRQGQEYLSRVQRTPETRTTDKNETDEDELEAFDDDETDE